MDATKILEVTQKLKEAFAQAINPNPPTRQLLPSEKVLKMPQIRPAARWQHLLWMCDQIETFVTNNKLNKAQRWLGFLQGVAWFSGAFSIDDMRTQNKPYTD